MKTLLKKIISFIKKLFKIKYDTTLKKKIFCVLDSTRPINFINIPPTVVSYKNLDNSLNLKNIRKEYLFKGIIYGIENNLTKKIYIGSTTNGYQRIGNHLSYPTSQTKNSNSFLQNSIKVYGLSNFTLHIFKVVKKPKQKSLLFLEQKYINLFPIKQMFNISLRTGSTLDHKKINKQKHKKTHKHKNT